MKKLIIAFAAVAMSMGVVANAQDANPAPCDQTCAKQNCKDKSACRQGRLCPFEGLNLTEAQQAQLKEVFEQQRAAKADKKADKKEAKKEAKQQRKDAKINARREYLAEIKNILTPEQYVQFLENSYVNTGKNFGPKQNGPRGGKPGDRNHGPRPDKR